MSWEQTRDLLQDIAEQINTNNAIPLPADLWAAFEARITPLTRIINPNIVTNFTQLDDIIWSPRPIEIARLLRLLRQRRRVNDNGRDLVGRLRVQVRPRERPDRNRPLETITDYRNRIARIGRQERYSSFQVNGWQRVVDTIRNNAGLVIVAPTGAGKTEVFLLPIVYGIAHALDRDASAQNAKRFILLYSGPNCQDTKTEIKSPIHSLSF